MQATDAAERTAGAPAESRRPCSIREKTHAPRPECHYTPGGETTILLRTVRRFRNLSRRIEVAGLDYTRGSVSPCVGLPFIATQPKPAAGGREENDERFDNLRTTGGSEWERPED